MLKVGDRAPEFTLPDHAGQERSLTSFLGDVVLVLYFYPADFTFGCTRQACRIRDLHDRLIRAKLKVVGVSPQDPATHARFREHYRLPFTLLSDVHKEVVKMYQVNGPLGMGVRRVTYLIDGSRRIRGVLRADIAVGKHARFIKEAIAMREPPPR
ncbi:MAG: peroxiredoxin [Proteobacteria bacterium]|nr:peroxiredoxin [Pseudomonadota bacterium]